MPPNIKFLSLPCCSIDLSNGLTVSKTILIKIDAFQKRLEWMKLCGRSIQIKDIAGNSTALIYHKSNIKVSYDPENFNYWLQQNSDRFVLTILITRKLEMVRKLRTYIKSPKVNICTSICKRSLIIITIKLCETESKCRGKQTSKQCVLYSGATRKRFQSICCTDRSGSTNHLLKTSSARFDCSIYLTRLIHRFGPWKIDYVLKRLETFPHSSGKASLCGSFFAFSGVSGLLSSFLHSNFLKMVH